MLAKSKLMQPPPRGCVLKPDRWVNDSYIATQPPPRGCVLKHYVDKDENGRYEAAASARLCVETTRYTLLKDGTLAAASARLCVETSNS